MTLRSVGSAVATLGTRVQQSTTPVVQTAYPRVSGMGYGVMVDDLGESTTRVFC